jgi:hypothetical protein
MRGGAIRLNGANRVIVRAAVGDHEYFLYGKTSRHAKS